jgi:hypothetical protein
MPLLTAPWIRTAITILGRNPAKGKDSSSVVLDALTGRF